MQSIKVDWESDVTQLLLNPRMPIDQQKLFQRVLDYSEEYSGHLWLTTSGSTKLKLAALSKKGMLNSARAVNRHLKCTADDIWLNPLPLFHVGGLGILARAYLAGSQVVFYEDRWDVSAYCQMLEESSASLSSLVPAQVFDIVQQKIRAPKSVRAILVGGGALSSSLYEEATKLDWRLLPTYAMTECSSSIAIAPLSFGQGYPSFQILPHMDLKIDAEGKICIQSESLLSSYAFLDGDQIAVRDPKVDGVLVTQDLGLIENGKLKLLGRVGDFVKIGGESVNVARLEQILEEIKLQHGTCEDLALIAVPDSRLGHVIHLAVSQKGDYVNTIIDQFHQQVMPFERIRQVHQVNKIPRSPMNKLLKKELLQQIR